MTEVTQEVTQEQNQEQPVDGQNINISIEQILAAVLTTVGTTTVTVENLITNYSGKQIAVNQNEDKTVTFSLVDAPVETEEVVVENPTEE